MFDNPKKELEDMGIIVLCFLALCAVILGSIIYETKDTNTMNGDINYAANQYNTTKIYNIENSQVSGGSLNFPPTPAYSIVDPDQFYANRNTDCSYFEGRPVGKC